MRIKSKTDVITNSSTEVFILRHPEENYEEINKLLHSQGFKGDVSKFTKEIWESREDSDYRLESLNYFFPDRESKNRAYYYLYKDYIFHPKSETPEKVFLGDSEHLVYPDLDVKGEGELREKLTKEILIPYCKQELKDNSNSDHLISNFKKFLEDPVENFSYYPGAIIAFRCREEFQKWIDENIDLFPDYNLLLKMYDQNDISEFFGTWIDFFEDDEIDFDEYAGNLDENLDYIFYRLS